MINKWISLDASVVSHDAKLPKLGIFSTEKLIWLVSVSILLAFTWNFEEIIDEFQAQVLKVEVTHMFNRKQAKNSNGDDWIKTKL